MSSTEPNTPPGHRRYKGVLLDKSCPTEHIERCLTFAYQPTDIIVVSYPRSGTLLSQETIWHIMNRSTIEVNKKHEPFFNCFPFLELFSKDLFPDPIEILESQKDQDYRLIKSHLNEHILYPALESSKPKIVLLLRNPKDVMVSVYEFYRTFAHDYEDWPYNWDNYFQNLVDKNVWYGNYFDWCQGWLKRKDLSNVFIVHYEDLVLKKHLTIKSLAEFLGQGDINESQIDITVKNTGFKQMFDNESINPDFGAGRLMRQGKIGSWKNHFSEMQSSQIDSVIEKVFEQIDINTE